MSQSLFGLVPAGLPVITQPSETPTPTSFVYSIPTGQKPFSHVVVFLLPGIVLPENTAAAIYLVTPPNPAQGHIAPNTRFLGGVGPGKESAIFKLNESSATQQIILGISIEDAASVAARIEELNAAKTSAAAATSSMALVPAGAGASNKQQPSTLVLAQRIIKNAFNFLSGFSGQAGQVEVVPLRAFEDWWRKFESKAFLAKSVSLPCVHRGLDQIGSDRGPVINVGTIPTSSNTGRARFEESKEKGTEIRGNRVMSMTAYDHPAIVNSASAADV